MTQASGLEQGGPGGCTPAFCIRIAGGAQGQDPFPPFLSLSSTTFRWPGLGSLMRPTPATTTSNPSSCAPMSAPGRVGITLMRSQTLQQGHS